MWIQIPPALSKSGFFSSLVSTLHFFPSFFFFSSLFNDKFCAVKSSPTWSPRSERGLGERSQQSPQPTPTPSSLFQALL